MSFLMFVYFFGAFAKLRKVNITFIMSVRPLDGFSLNLIFEYFLKIYLENSSYIKI
jgi:hypothetical protein